MLRAKPAPAKPAQPPPAQNQSESQKPAVPSPAPPADPAHQPAGGEAGATGEAMETEEEVTPGEKMETEA